MQHVSWSRSANIYEVNVRQYTPEGTLNAFAAHLPRLHQMGVDILWFMPIQPIGKLKRKGKLGSYYAVADYAAVNPEFGTLKDFKALVQQAHALGMKVIIDWVANHTAWDHVWVKQHPDWYLKNDKGEIHSFQYDNGTEVEDWSDVVGLDYSQKPLWTAMTQAMQFWVKEADIDGFRCDVAQLLPLKFWQQARAKLDALKPMFMLAESDNAQLHDQAFDMTYDWALQNVLKKIAKGQADVRDLQAYLVATKAAYPADAYRTSRPITTPTRGITTMQPILERPLPPWPCWQRPCPGCPWFTAVKNLGCTKCCSFLRKTPSTGKLLSTKSCTARCWP
ncbi:MAG: Alpha-amylase 2 [Pseudomonadota bacterium]